MVLKENLASARAARAARAQAKSAAPRAGDAPEMQVVQAGDAQEMQVVVQEKPKVWRNRWQLFNANNPKRSSGRYKTQAQGGPIRASGQRKRRLGPVTGRRLRGKQPKRRRLRGKQPGVPGVDYGL